MFTNLTYRKKDREEEEKGFLPACEGIDSSVADRWKVNAQQAEPAVR
jgi:hypothetical protein